MKHGNTASNPPPTRKKALTQLRNCEGGIVYDVVDMDFDSNIFELIDPHTQASFLIYNARETLNLLGYEVKDD